MSLKFKKPWVRYNEPKAKKVGKSMTVPGQSIAMSVMIQRYMSGQIFGLSQNQVTYDTENDDVDIEHFEGRYRPDPADFCAPERAILEHKSIQKHLKTIRDEKIKDNIKNGRTGEVLTEPIPKSPETTT